MSSSSLISDFGVPSTNNTPTSSNNSELSFCPEFISTARKRVYKKNNNGGSPSFPTKTRTVSDDFDSNSDSELYQNPRISRKGAEWKLFKPVNDETRLYYKVVMNYENIYDTAKNWVYVYKTNPVRALKSFKQLFIDVAGFQHFNFDMFIEPENDQLLLNHIENGIPSNIWHTLNTYLVRSQTVCGKSIFYNITEFLRMLIHVSHETALLYNYKLMYSILSFLKVFSFCKVRCVCHTAVAISLKLLNILLDLYDTCKISNKQSKERKHYLKQYFEFLYYIFKKNCMLNDAKLYLMRLQCAQECVSWINKNPYFFFDKCLDCLLKLTTDVSEKVRCATLISMKKLLKNSFLNQFLRKNNLFFNAIEKRVLDINNQVRKNAIELEIVAINLYVDKLSEETRNVIFKFIYLDDCGLAMVAAKFLANYLEKADGNISVTELLLRFTSFAKIIINSIPLLIEAALPSFKPLHNFNLLVDVLLNHKEIRSDEKVVLFLIIIQSAQQIITGKSQISRKNSRRGRVNVSRNGEIVETLLPHLPRLLKEYGNIDGCFVKLMELMLIFDYQFLNVTMHKFIILEILKILNRTYMKSTSIEDLRVIIKYYTYICDSLSPFHTIASDIVREVGDRVIENFSIQFSRVIKEESKENWENLMCVSLKIVTGSPFFNFTDQLDWNRLIEFMNPELAKPIAEDCQVICSWYLIWSFKTLLTKNLANEELIAQIELLNEARDRYLSICFTYLNSNSLFFDNICKMLIEFKRNVYSVKEDINYKKFDLALTEEYSKMLMEFVQTNVFEHKTADLKQRKLWLLDFINLIIVNAVSSEFLSEIYKYYNMQLADYGDVFKLSFKTFYNHNKVSLAVIVTRTLWMFYNNISQTRSSRASLGDEILFMKLTHEFVTSLNHDLHSLILEIGIRAVAMKFTSNSFLYQLQEFSKHCTDQGLSDLLNLVFELLPEESLKEVPVKNFIKSLRKPIQPLIAASPIDNDISSVSEDIDETFTIEEDKSD